MTHWRLRWPPEPTAESTWISTRRGNVQSASVTGSARTTDGTSGIEDAELLIEILDDLPNALLKLYDFVKDLSPAIILVIAGLGVLFEWHMAVNLLIFILTLNAGRKAVEKSLDNIKKIFQRKRNRRLGHILGHDVNFKRLHGDSIRIDDSDTESNFRIFDYLIRPQRTDGAPGSVAKEIKVGRRQISKMKTKFPADNPGPDEVRIDKGCGRPMIGLSFYDGFIKTQALVDTGAMSSVISEDLVKEIEDTGIKVLRTNEKFTVEGIIPDARNKHLEGVLLDVTVGGKLKLDNVPFIVMKSKDVILGMNVIKACRLSTGYDKDGDLFIQVMNENRLENVSVCIDHEELEVVNVNEVTIHPNSFGVIDLEIPRLRYLPKNNINNTNVLVEGNEEILDDKDLFIIPSVSRVIRGRLKVIFKNNTGNSFKMPNGLPIAKISDASHLDNFATKKDWVNFGEFSRVAIGLKTIPQFTALDCPCRLRRESHVITLCDGSGYSKYRSCALSVAENEVFEDSIEDGKIPEGIVIGPPFYKNGGRDISIMKNEKGRYRYSDEVISKMIKDTCDMSLQSDFKLMCDWNPFKIERDRAELILQIKQNCPDLKIVNVDLNTKFCEECLPFEKITIQMSGLYHVENVHVHFLTGSYNPSRDITDSDIDHPVMRFKLMRSWVSIHIRDKSAIIVIHCPGYSYFGSFGYLRRLMVLILKDLYLTGLGYNLTISGSSQTNSARIEGYNLMIMKAFASATSEFSRYEPIIWRSRLNSGQKVQDGAKRTEEVNLCFRECGCGFCQSRKSNKPPVVSKETTLYNGTFSDFERITRETEELFDQSKVNEQVVTIIGRSVTQPEVNGEDISLGDFQLEDHGATFEDAGEDQLVPYPVMLDVPTEDELNISREWRDYVDLEPVPKNMQKEFSEILDRHKDIFAYGPNEVKFVKEDGATAELDIEMVDDKPLWTKPFGLAGPILQKLEEKIEELLKAGLIEPIKSDWNSPVFMVPHNSAAKNEKAEERKYRMIVDLRVVNSMVKFSNRHSYLVKGIEFAMEKLRNKKYFTVLDMNKAYRSLKVSQKSREICAFIVPNSTKWPTQSFAFKSLIDGLNLGPGYYSYLINKALSYESRKATMIHIDDVCIASETLEQHMKDIDRVMGDLTKNGFMVAASKVKFFQTETRFLGHNISLNKITIDEKRKALFKEVPVPKTKKEMMRFLGMANYMASFCDSFILRAGPLFDSLKGRKKEFVLSPEQIKAFEEVKEMIDNAPPLKIIDFSKPVIMEVDASYVGAGSVVYQEKTDEKGKVTREVIRYGSKRFSIQQCLMYTSLEKESLAIMYGIQQHSFFLGNSIDTIIRTDMKALICILSCYNNPTNHRMARVAHFLYSLPYSWQLAHISGEENIAADILSRCIPDYRCAFSDRLRSFKDLSRESIKLPKEWTRTPNVILSTADIMNNLKNNMLMEEVSDKVMEKRIKAFTQLGHDLMNDEFIPSADVTNKLREIEENRLKAEAKSNSTMNVGAVKTYPVSINHLITTKFLSDYQNRDQFIGGLKTKLRSAGSHRSGFKLRYKYRLLNDTVVVTRADKNIPFEEAYNLRILCSEEMALIILSYLHLFNNHAGFNALVKMFNVAYKTQGLIALTKIVTKCCRSCSLETLNPNHIVPKGRIPLPERPMSTWWVDHMVFGGELTIKGKKVDSALNFLDGYSGLLISHLVPNQKVETTMECFRKTFASMGVPDTIVTDNHKALNLNEKLRRYLSSQGVKNIVTTSPYHSQANKCERIHKTLRRAIRLAGETFCRNPIEIYHQIVLMVNSRPLVVSDHPLIRKLIAKSDRYVSPFDLHYGRPMTFNPMNELLNSKFGEDEEERRKFQEKWNKLLVDLDEEKRRDLEVENENFHRPPGYEIGDIVYMVNNARHKESLRFIRNLFVIVDNKWKKFRLRPLFGNPNGNEFQAHADDLKAYNFSHLLEILPPELKALMGQNVSPDKLKEKVQNDPKYIPDDLLPKNVFEEIGLRNRLTPRSVGSIPAILSSDGSFISDEFRFQGENWSDVESTPSAKGSKRVLPKELHQGSDRSSKKKEELEERREEGRVSGGSGPRNVSSPKKCF